MESIISSYIAFNPSSLHCLLIFSILLYGSTPNLFPEPEGTDMEVPEKFKEMIENESDDDDELEKISEAFICCVCRRGKGYGLLLPANRCSPLQPEQKIIKPSNASVPCFSETDSSLNPCSVRAGETLDIMEHVHSGSVHQDIGLGNLLDSRKDNAATSAPIAEDRNSNQIHRGGTCKQASVDDVLCDSCNHMLFRPIVLNCGHAFCICCIVPQTSEMLKCQVCQSPHPGDIPKVCLEFDHFLEEQFPKEYGLRREALQMKMKHEQFLSEPPTTCSSEAGKESFHFSFSSGEDPLPWWNASSKVHIGVGCDACGMYPIIGDRYRCKDCVEQIGYDLCKDCYTTRSKLPGRFNQQHTSEHKFEIVKSNAMHNIMLRLLRGQLQEVSAVSDALHDTSANAIPSSDNTNEDEENVADAIRPSSETEANESENQRLA
ncbi:UNVERIFIED_CONTAM: E3 ubiquitin-protein ligase PRT1 [Sesamum latifolium]|uniref:E3 ubiquitin-protein ligase PRT1 n=1 Tax=Sesamum latifolium TaxID=2727402 RepID=A0AAW2XYT8_9LAMI